MKCPTCAGSLCAVSERAGGYACGNMVCPFFITSTKFNKVVQGLYNEKTRRAMDAEDNMEALNNL